MLAGGHCMGYYPLVTVAHRKELTTSSSKRSLAQAVCVEKQKKKELGFYYNLYLYVQKHRAQIHLAIAEKSFYKPIC